jgi:hypothetical protein
MRNLKRSHQLTFLWLYTGSIPLATHACNPCVAGSELHSLTYSHSLLLCVVDCLLILLTFYLVGSLEGDKVTRTAVTTTEPSGKTPPIVSKSSRSQETAC